MDVFTHTIIALVCMFGAYLVGRFQENRKGMALLRAVMEKMEKDGKLVVVTKED